MILPDLGAGCSMADMANLDQTLDCWAQLEETCPGQTIVPITYMNSSAAIKAFVGEHGGAVCTSSNCRNVLEWALRGSGSGCRVRRQDRTQRAAASSTAQLQRSSSSPTSTSAATPPTPWATRSTTWSSGTRARTSAATTRAALRDADFVLWKGHCSVHQLFRPEHVDQVRDEYPGHEGDRASRVPLGGRAESRPGRQHRLHRQANRSRPARQPMGRSAPKST